MKWASASTTEVGRRWPSRLCRRLPRRPSYAVTAAGRPRPRAATLGHAAARAQELLRVNHFGNLTRARGARRRFQIAVAEVERHNLLRCARDLDPASISAQNRTPENSDILGDGENMVRDLRERVLGTPEIFDGRLPSAPARYPRCVRFSTSKEVS